MKKHDRGNPFYALVLVVGFIFIVTVCAYGVLTIRATHGQVGEGRFESASPGPLAFLDRHGATILAAELGMMALVTVGLLVVDCYYHRTSAALGREPSTEPANLDDDCSVSQGVKLE